jgi:hypothetical protein
MKFVLIYKDSAMGIFSTKKKAKKARDRLIKHDCKKYPRFKYRLEQQKAAYIIMRPLKKHKDPFA